ncbi:MAG: ACT domain-containing protein [Sphingomonadales bacterium]|nr:ACT domain-containing protein [Sphingomonadales bacterium]MDE2570550.1 ACT domain-containing protein [Sphingomonadales bacterium]
MIAGMAPRLDSQTYAFVSAEAPGQALDLMRQALATFREDEGLALIVPMEAAEEAGIAADAYARITLMVNSALDGVGLTAAVASCLAEAGIACNMVAAYRHDHVFVPAAEANRALGLLREIEARASEATETED